MTADLVPAPVAPAKRTPPRNPRASATRSQSVKRARRREELMKGNRLAWRHGIFATVLSQPDILTEIDLVYVANPDLDAVVDYRLVEQLATSRVRLTHAVQAMDREGLTNTLTAYASRLDMLVERLERAVHERARENARTRRDRTESAVLTKYREVQP